MIGIPRHSVPAKVPEDAKCQEASHLSGRLYVACNAPATCVVDNGDTNVYFMCTPCGDHNVRNRGGRYLLNRYGNTGGHQ